MNRRRYLALFVVILVIVIGVAVWRAQQPPSVRLAALSFVSAMTSCDGEALYALATPEERSRYDAAALRRVCLAMRDDVLGGLQLVDSKSDSPHAAQSGDADATFRAGDGTEFECGADVLRYGERPVGSVVLQMRIMVMQYIMARDGVDVDGAREIFTRDYLAKFQAAGANEVYLLPYNEWKPMR